VRLRSYGSAGLVKLAAISPSGVISLASLPTDCYARPLFDNSEKKPSRRDCIPYVFGIS
jgi:hypothetical protein